MRAHLEGCVVARVQLNERVDFINGVSQLEVSVCGGHFQLCDHAVYFADEQADGQALLIAFSVTSITPSTASTTSRTPSASRMAAVTSSLKLTCPAIWK